MPITQERMIDILKGLEYYHERFESLRGFVRFSHDATYSDDIDALRTFANALCEQIIRVDSDEIDAIKAMSAEQRWFNPSRQSYNARNKRAQAIARDIKNPQRQPRSLGIAARNGAPIGVPATIHNYAPSPRPETDDNKPPDFAYPQGTDVLMDKLRALANEGLGLLTFAAIKATILPDSTNPNAGDFEVQELVDELVRTYRYLEEVEPGAYRIRKDDNEFSRAIQRAGVE
jgi:hypothetical protein